MEKVSVIMAAYNCENYINKSIDSILAQSYENFELIICDDNSTDNTWNIIKTYENNKRIKIIRNEKNMYAAYTRNKCIINATGKYIIIQDADDISEERRIETLVSFLETNKKYGFVGSSINLFDDIGIWATMHKPEEPQNKDFLYAIPFAHASVMFRKELLDIINGYRVSKETKRVEDYDMIMRAYVAGYVGYNLKIPLYNYRVDNNTIQRRKFKYRIDEAKVRYKRFKELGLLPKGLGYVVKPIIVGLIPNTLLKKIKRKIPG
jgi:glycosyltransferase EpsE